MARPSSNFFWADADASVRAEPSDAKKHNGWNIQNEVPNRQNTNWLFYFIGIWLGYINESFTRRYNSFGQAMSDFANLNDFQEFSVSNGSTSLVNLSSSIAFSNAFSYSHLNPASSGGGAQKISTNGKYLICHVVTFSGTSFNKLVCHYSDQYNGDYSGVKWTSTIDVATTDVWCSDSEYLYIFDNAAKRLTILLIEDGSSVLSAFDVGVIGTQIVYDIICDGKNMFILLNDSATSDWFVVKYNVEDVENPVVPGTSYLSDNAIDHKSICTDGRNVYIGMNAGGANGNIIAISYSSMTLVNGHTIDANVTKCKTDGEYIYLSTNIGIYRFGVNCAGIIDSKEQMYAFPANDICIDGKYVFFAMQESDPSKGWMFAFAKHSSVVSGAYFWDSNSYPLTNPVRSVCSDGQKVFVGGWIQDGVAALTVVGLNLPDNVILSKKLPRTFQGRRFEGLHYSMT